MVAFAILAMLCLIPGKSSCHNLQIFDLKTNYSKILKVDSSFLQHSNPNLVSNFPKFVSQAFKNIYMKIWRQHTYSDLGRIALQIEIVFICSPHLE